MSNINSMKITVNKGCRQYNFLVLGDAICKSTTELQQFMIARFPNEMKHETNLRAFWYDQDGDEISIAKDADYRSFMLAAVDGKARLFVEGREFCPEKVKSSTDSGVARPEHTNIVCDVCDQEIVGHRYRCLTCHDYDLCMRCEHKFRHKDHIMLRIPRPTVGSRSAANRLFEKVRLYAGKIELSPEETNLSPEGGDGDADVGTSKAEHEPATRMRRRGDAQRQTYTLKPYGCGVKPNGKPHTKNCPLSAEYRQEALQKAQEASASMRQQAKQARYHEIMSQFVDPANINGTGGPSPSLATPAAPSTWDKDLMAEARRSAELAAESAKVASNAATASWNTFLDCAGKFIPPKAVKKSTGEGTTVAPLGWLNHAVAGLPHPNAYEWLMPTEQEVQTVSDGLSKLLKPLGLGFNMPPSATGEASPQSSFSQPDTAGTAEKVKAQPEENSEAKPKETSEDKQEASATSSGTQNGENAVSDTVVEQKVEQAAQASNSMSLQTDSAHLANVPDVPTATQEQEPMKQPTENDDCSGDTSSGSLLTDDDEDVLEAAVEASELSEPIKKASSSLAPREVPWILVDLPDDVEQEEKCDVAIRATTSASSLGPTAAVTSSTPSSGSVSEREQASEVAPLKEQESDETYQTIFQALQEITLHPETAFENITKLGQASLKEQNKSPNLYLYHFDRAVKDIQAQMDGKDEKQRTEQMQMKEQQKAVVDAAVADATTVTARIPTPKKVTTLASPSSNTLPFVPTANTGSGALPRSQQDYHVPSLGQPPASQLIRYSSRPHVNHAIHNMMSMGFSNSNGHLTRLLETLDGNVTRALDMLLQNVP